MQAVTGELAGEGIYGSYFRRARRSAIHIEVRDTYHMPDEDEPTARWRESGEIIETAGGRAWCAMVAETVSRGVTVSRVRVVTVPHTEYTRWLLDACASNIAAGEQIRYLPRHEVDGHVPEDDYWLFDDEIVGFNTVDADGDGVGLAVTADTEIVDVCARAAARLWAHSTDHGDYLRRGFDSR